LVVEGGGGISEDVVFGVAVVAGLKVVVREDDEVAVYD
jgi:hypothetical protein